MHIGQLYEGPRAPLQQDSYTAAIRASPAPFLPEPLHLGYEATANALGRLEVCLQWAFGRRGRRMKQKERMKDRISEREYHDRLTSLMKGNFNAQLKPLRSLKTATKKRRGRKKECAK
jgi:hypothetical protein